MIFIISLDKGLQRYYIKLNEVFGMNSTCSEPGIHIAWHSGCVLLFLRLSSIGLVFYFVDVPNH
jgi:hypothetical protein